MVRRRSRGMALGGSRGDWVVGSKKIDGTGAEASISSWSGTTVTLTSGGSNKVGFLAYEIPLSAGGGGNNAAPGRVRVLGIQGSIFLANANAVGPWRVGVGIYKASQLTTTPTWQAKDPQADNDAARDDWLFVRLLNFSLATAAAGTGVQQVEVPLVLARPVDLGGGEALCVMVSATSGASTIDCIAGFRSLVSNLR